MKYIDELNFFENKENLITNGKLIRLINMDNSEMCQTAKKEYLKVQRRKSAMVSVF